MRKTTLRILSALLIVTLAAGLVPTRALAYTSAARRITMYNQHNAKYRDREEWGVYDHRSSLYKAGCRLFAYAHAIEWLTGKKAGEKLLRQLLTACCSPSNNYGHEYSGCKKSPYRHDDSKDAYNALAKKVYGLTAKSQKITISASSLRSFFDDGKVAIGSIGSHMVLAVDYVVCDKNLNVVKLKKGQSIPSDCKMYVQIIDSSADTSTARGALFYNKFYTMKSQKLVKGGKTLSGGSDSGQEYWVELATLKKKFSVSSVLYGGTWKGHSYE